MKKRYQLNNHWWQGKRGEWYVVAQAGLFLVILLGPRGAAIWPLANTPYSWLVISSGWMILACGILLTLAGVVGLGANLTPLPAPKEKATLVQSGAYKIVRHPIYGGLIVMVLGWSLVAQDWLMLVYAILTGLFFDFKARREERWLISKFPGYGAYQARVRKLIPFIY